MDENLEQEETNIQPVATPKSSADTPRVQSGRRSSQRISSGKSRPDSGHSSLNTDIEEKELRLLEEPEQEQGEVIPSPA